MTKAPNTNASDAGAGVKVVDLGTQMRLLDALPAELKTLISKAPVAVDVEQIWQIWRLHGPKAAALIKAALEQAFPDWRMD